MGLTIFKIVNRLGEEIKFCIYASCHEHLIEIKKVFSIDNYRIVKPHGVNIFYLDFEWCKDIEIFLLKTSRYLYSYNKRDIDPSDGSSYCNRRIIAITIICRSTDDFSIDVEYAKCNNYGSCWLSKCDKHEIRWLPEILNKKQDK